MGARHSGVHRGARSLSSAEEGITLGGIPSPLTRALGGSKAVSQLNMALLNDHHTSETCPAPRTSATGAGTRALADRRGHLQREAPRRTRRRRGLAGPPLGARALPHHLQLPRAPAILAHGRGTHRRPARRRVSQPQPPSGPHCRRPEHRPDSARTRVMDADLCPRPQRLRAPRTAVERGPRRLPGNLELTDRGLARRRGSTSGEIEKTALPRPRLPADDLPKKRLGATAPRTDRIPTLDEPALHGDPPVLGRRPVLASTPRLTHR